MNNSCESELILSADPRRLMITKLNTKIEDDDHDKLYQDLTDAQNSLMKEKREHEKVILRVQGLVRDINEKNEKVLLLEDEISDFNCNIIETIEVIKDMKHSLDSPPDFPHASEKKFFSFCIEYINAFHQQVLTERRKIAEFEEFIENTKKEYNNSVRTLEKRIDEHSSELSEAALIIQQLQEEKYLLENDLDEVKQLLDGEKSRAFQERPSRLSIRASTMFESPNCVSLYKTEKSFLNVNNGKAINEGGVAGGGVSFKEMKIRKISTAHSRRSLGSELTNGWKRSTKDDSCLSSTSSSSDSISSTDSHSSSSSNSSISILSPQTSHHAQKEEVKCSHSNMIGESPMHQLIPSPNSNHEEWLTDQSQAIRQADCPHVNNEIRDTQSLKPLSFTCQRCKNPKTILSFQGSLEECTFKIDPTPLLFTSKNLRPLTRDMNFVSCTLSNSLPSLTFHNYEPFEILPCILIDANMQCEPVNNEFESNDTELLIEPNAASPFKTPSPPLDAVELNAADFNDITPLQPPEKSYTPLEIISVSRLPPYFSSPSTPHEDNKDIACGRDDSHGTSTTAPPPPLAANPLDMDDYNELSPRAGGRVSSLLDPLSSSFQKDDLRDSNLSLNDCSLDLLRQDSMQLPGTNPNAVDPLLIVSSSSSSSSSEIEISTSIMDLTAFPSSSLSPPSNLACFPHRASLTPRGREFDASKLHLYPTHVRTSFTSRTHMGGNDAFSRPSIFTTAEDAGEILAQPSPGVCEHNPGFPLHPNICLQKSSFFSHPLSNSDDKSQIHGFILQSSENQMLRDNPHRLSSPWSEMDFQTLQKENSQMKSLLQESAYKIKSLLSIFRSSTSTQSISEALELQKKLEASIRSLRSTQRERNRLAVELTNLQNYCICLRRLCDKRSVQLALRKSGNNAESLLSISRMLEMESRDGHALIRTLYEANSSGRNISLGFNSVQKRTHKLDLVSNVKQRMRNFESVLNQEQENKEHLILQKIPSPFNSGSEQSSDASSTESNNNINEH